MMRMTKTRDLAVLTGIVSSISAGCMTKYISDIFLSNRKVESPSKMLVGIINKCKLEMTTNKVVENFISDINIFIDDKDIKFVNIYTNHFNTSDDIYEYRGLFSNIFVSLNKDGKVVFCKIKSKRDLLQSLEIFCLLNDYGVSLVKDGYILELRNS